MSSPHKNNPAASKPIQKDIQEFLIDRQARRLTRKTLRWYKDSLNIWLAFVGELGIDRTEQVDPSTLRRFLVHLADCGHNDGGVANIYGAVRSFLRWFADEYAPPGWVNPASRIKNPKRPDAPLDPLDIGHFNKLLATCEPKTFAGDRDRALLLFLLDTGMRHQEVTDVAVGDVDLLSGEVLIRQGKGRKSRFVFVGPTTRRALAAYLRYREDDGETALWLTRTGTPLSRSGIFEVVRRRATAAGVPVPGMHEFRRAFAVNYLRAGGDVATLQRLMGHTDLRVINRYLKLLNEDLRRAHEQFSPVENLKRKSRS